MEIKQAITSIGDKADIMKAGVNKAQANRDDMIDFVDMMLEQYNETEGNKNLMNQVFGSDVMKCIIEYAREVNAFADVQLMNLQDEEAQQNDNIMPKGSNLKRRIMRKRLVELIVDHSGDELEKEDYKIMASESEEELIERIAQIIEYFRAGL